MDGGLDDGQGEYTLLRQFGKALELILDEPMRELDDTNVFVKYLPNDVDDDGLRTLFREFGPIASSKVMVDLETGKSLGYGFVRFDEAADASAAVAAMSGFRIANKRLLCKLSHYNPPKEKPTVSDNLFVKPLAADMDDVNLHALFAQYGRVAEVKVMRHRRTNESRRFGFVRFADPADANAAIAALSGKRLEPGSAPLIIKFAESQNQKKSRKRDRASLRTSRKCKDSAILVRQFYAHVQRLARDGALPAPLALAVSPSANPWLSPSASAAYASLADAPPSSSSASFDVGPPLFPSAADVAAATSFPVLAGYAHLAVYAPTPDGGHVFLGPLHPHMDAPVLYAMAAPFGRVVSVAVFDGVLPSAPLPAPANPPPRFAIILFAAAVTAEAAALALDGYRQGRTTLAATAASGAPAVAYAAHALTAAGIAPPLAPAPAPAPTASRSALAAAVSVPEWTPPPSLAPPVPVPHTHTHAVPPPAHPAPLWAAAPDHADHTSQATPPPQSAPPVWAPPTVGLSPMLYSAFSPAGGNTLLTPVDVDALATGDAPLFFPPPGFGRQ